ncbi:MAG: LLM class flavin-dependent oxidoreductase, partial [Pseudonocardiales bacterium]|nr:LLM class flavin-dependent oxidoreductase [Pseudonocardiales bacterium]
MQLSVPLSYGADSVQTAADVIAWERAGLDLVWVAEAYSFDAPSMLGYLAAKTERV